MLRATLILVGALVSVSMVNMIKVGSVTSSTQDRRCSRDLYKQIRLIWNAMECTPADKRPSNCKFYTPSSANNKLLCPVNTLKCFAVELKVLQKEWETNSSWFNTPSSLEKLSSLFSQNNSACSQCEIHQEQNSADFLRALLNMLQWINSKYCRRTSKRRDEA